MALDRDALSPLVDRALSRVADYDTFSEEFEFRRFLKYHRVVFLAELRAAVTATVRDENGHYDVQLTLTVMDEWETIGDCLDWLEENVFLRRRKTQRLTSDELDPS